MLEILLHFLISDAPNKGKKEESKNAGLKEPEIKQEGSTGWFGSIGKFFKRDKGAHLPDDTDKSVFIYFIYFVPNNLSFDAHEFCELNYFSIQLKFIQKRIS